ncbi:MAG: FecR/PupR family sigma factor regulator [Brevundimonas sp.]
MTNTSGSPSQGVSPAADGVDLDAEATVWVVRLAGGELEPEEEQAFRLWRDQGPLQAAALERARRFWLTLGLALEDEFVACRHCGGVRCGHA